jgi:hypothetical protein
MAAALWTTLHAAVPELDPLGAIARLATCWAAAFVLDGDVVTRYPCARATRASRLA